jgi:hypothetical protein
MTSRNVAGSLFTRALISVLVSSVVMDSSIEGVDKLEKMNAHGRSTVSRAFKDDTMHGE